MNESSISTDLEPATASEPAAALVSDVSLSRSGTFERDAEGVGGYESSEPPDEEAVLRRAAVELAERKSESRLLAVLASASYAADASFETITTSLADPSPAVRSVAVRALYQLNPEAAASFLNTAIRESPSEQRKSIGAALVGSGLIVNVPSDIEDARVFYSARSMLFLLAKFGEVEPLLDTIRSHPNLELRIALVKMLGQSEAPEVVPAFEKLLLDLSQPREIRTVIKELLVHVVKV